MITQEFEFRAPDKLDEALTLLADGGDDIKLLSGGMSLMPMMVGLAGWAYSIAATVLGFGLIWLSADFARTRSGLTARRLFLFSIVYLPLLWGALCLDRLWL